MAYAGHQTTLKATGVPVAMVAAATTCLDPGTYKRFQVTDATKQALDPRQTINVYKNAVLQAASLYSLNHPWGIVTFASGLIITDVVTITATYLPQLSIAAVRSSRVTLTRSLQETTSYDSGGVKTRMGTLKDVALTFEGLSLGGEDMDPGAAKVTLEDGMANGDPFLFEQVIGGGAVAGMKFRGYFVPESLEDSAEVEALVQGAFSAQLAFPTPASGQAPADHAFAFDNWT